MGLVDISCHGRDPIKVRITDRQKGQTIWEGLLKPGGSIYQRWTFTNEDDFTEGEQFELPLAAEIDGGRAIELPIAVTAETFQPSWPNYSAGSLHPDEVPEGELYGRGQIIKQIINTFGPTRSTVNYLIIKSVRQTTLLFFIKNAAPAHVLPIYIDLERAENEYGTISGTTLLKRFCGRLAQRPRVWGLGREARHSDLILLDQEIYKKTRKKYIVLLVNELHVLLRDPDKARRVLAEFRADLNQPANRIAVLFADRYTLHESEMTVPFEIWLQLSELRLGPLDRESTAAAINVPCASCDADFLPETIDAIYHWTGGYPFHVQRVVQAIIEANFPWP